MNDKAIDYSPSLIETTQTIRKINDALLARRYDTAQELMLHAVVCLREAYIAVRYIKEQENALRQQASSVQERV
jgi:hypothetical protein